MPIKNIRLKPEVDFTDRYVNSLTVLKNVLNRAGLTLGATVAEELLEEIKGHRLLKVKLNETNEKNN